jgi:hypothetical protein
MSQKELIVLSCDGMLWSTVAFALRRSREPTDWRTKNEKDIFSFSFIARKGVLYDANSY